MVYSAPPSEPATLDAVFAALAHPARRELVTYLAGRSSAPRMSDVAAARGLSPQLLNKHTAVLERAGLVRRSGTGAARFLVLDPDVLAAAQEWLLRTRSFWESRFDTLDDYIDTIKEQTDA